MSDCIEWTGARHDQGYGMKKIKGVQYYVHRLVWAEDNGPIPEGMVVRHSCDNPPCYNREHLVLGTYAQNSEDMVLRGRHPAHSQTHCLRGHEFIDENVWFTKAGTRRCRMCDAIRMREYRARKKAAA